MTKTRKPAKQTAAAAYADAYADALANVEMLRKKIVEHRAGLVAYEKMTGRPIHWANVGDMTAILHDLCNALDAR